MERVRGLVRECRPDLAADELVLLGEGDFSRAWLVDGRWVVRVPKHAVAAKALVREACLLERIGDRLPVPVPRPVHHAGRAEAGGEGGSCSIHERIGGVALTRSRWLGRAAGDRERLAGSVGGLLRRLHEIDPGRVAGCGIPVLDHAAEVAVLLRRLGGEAGRALPSSLRPRVVVALRELERRLDVDAPAPALLHADVSPEHVLVEGRPSALCGLIDWADAAIGDPARDFVFLYEDWGDDFLGLALRQYGATAPDRFRARVYLHQLADQLGWTLDAAAAGHGPDLDHGVQALRTVLDIVTV